MFGLSASHLLILGIIILLFGARRLPELGAGLGQSMKAFKDAIEGPHQNVGLTQSSKLIESARTESTPSVKVGTDVV
jgi:sec-independent protein translocase protein TatA